MVGANCMGGSNPDSPKELDEKVVVSKMEITTQLLQKTSFVLNRALSLARRNCSRCKLHRKQG